MKKEILLDDFMEIIPKICCRETSNDPDNWTSDNPTYGHCAVASLLIQELFGGALIKQSLLQTAEWSHMRSHFFNQLPDGRIIDSTIAQFKDMLPKDLTPEPRTREQVLLRGSMPERYKLFSERYERFIDSYNR
jgi:hypothetical protein